MDILTTAHQLLGYLVAATTVAATLIGMVEAREPHRGFAPAVYGVAIGLIDLQLVGGLVVYALGGYWEHDSLLVRYVHPALAIGAAVVAHLGLRRARSRPRATVAHRTLARTFALVILLVLGAVVTATLGVRGIGPMAS